MAPVSLRKVSFCIELLLSASRLLTVNGSRIQSKQYSCGDVPLQTIWAVYDQNTAAPERLMCGDTKSETATGSYDEGHLMMCTLSTTGKLAAYTPARNLNEKMLALYAWAKANTDCVIQDVQVQAGKRHLIFKFIAKPSERDILMELHKACFTFESSEGDSVVSPLKEILADVPVEKHDSVTQMVYGMILGYRKQATYDYMMQSFNRLSDELSAGDFDDMYTSARAKVLDLLKGSMSEELVHTLSERTKYTCGSAPLELVWKVYEPHNPLRSKPEKLRCGDQNTETAGGGTPAESEFMMCVLTTRGKLSAYTPPMESGARGLDAVYEWAAENTDCAIHGDSPEDGGFKFVAKPSSSNILMELSQSCFEYEDTSRLDSPLREIMEGIPEVDRDIYVQMVFGMILGYTKRATYDYMVVGGKYSNQMCEPEKFEAMYTEARQKVLALLGGAISGELLATLEQRTSTTLEQRASSMALGSEEPSKFKITWP